jgi:hypothetical protein
MRNLGDLRSTKKIKIMVGALSETFRFVYLASMKKFLV